MTTSTTSMASTTGHRTAIPGDSPQRVRRDLRFVRWYAHTIRHVIRRYQGGTGSGSGQDALRPADLLTSVEIEVAAECRRMRIMFRAIMSVLFMPLLLAVFLWSGLYWLPVTVPWFPFERGVYGLPLFSLFEWLAFLMLAAFLAGSLAVIAEGFESTRRVSIDFRRLSEASADERTAIAAEARSGDYPRSAYLLARAKPFADYAAELSPDAAGVRLGPGVST